MFCPAPFGRLEIKSDGNVYCCCEGWLPKPIGNVLETNLLEIFNGPAVREIRTSILDDSFRYCVACPYLPGPRGPVTSQVPPELAIPPALSMPMINTLKLDYDQTCQLQCQSCRTQHSREFVDLPKVERIHSAVVESGVLAHTKRLYVTGTGDPFASPLYWKFLRELHHLVLNPKLHVFLHTNGLLCDQEHLAELGSNLDLVSEIAISVDAATQETYQLVRGGSWSRLWDNVAFINSLQLERERENHKHQLVLGMFYTVQACNFRELLPFAELTRRHRVSWVSVTAMRNWGTFTPEDYRARAVHMPEHPDHAEFKRAISDPRLTSDRRINLERFDPSHTDQGWRARETLLPKDL